MDERRKGGSYDEVTVSRFAGVPARRAVAFIQCMPTHPMHSGYAMHAKESRDRLAAEPREYGRGQWEEPRGIRVIPSPRIYEPKTKKTKVNNPRARGYKPSATYVSGTYVIYSATEYAVGEQFNNGAMIGIVTGRFRTRRLWEYRVLGKRLVLPPSSTFESAAA
jgi:hypothetical protein